MEIKAWILQHYRDCAYLKSNIVLRNKGKQPYSVAFKVCDAHPTDLFMSYRLFMKWNAGNHKPKPTCKQFSY